MGNRYLSVVLGDLRVGLDSLKNLKSMVEEFGKDVPNVDGIPQEETQKLVENATNSIDETTLKVGLLKDIVMEALDNNG